MALCELFRNIFLCIFIFFINIQDVAVSTHVTKLSPRNIASPHEIDNYGIYGGWPINITKAPFVALFRPMDYDYFCGACIVHEQFLLTAAHCAIYTPFIKLRVTVGTDLATNGGQDYELEKAFVHPKYSRRTLDFDLAVIKLKNKMTFSDKVKPIQMAKSIPNDGDVLDNMGFGEKETGQPSEKLLQVKLPFVNHEECKKILDRGDVVVTDRMVCAGGEEGKGSCKGDSGGPLVGMKGELVGIASWVRGCARSGIPVVFASVPGMRDFIDDIIKNNA